MHKHRLNRELNKVFKSKEVLSSEKFYRFIEKKKIIVFVPEKFADILASEMSEAGAGVIGNYDMCSFRTQGTGTFRPGKNSKPFSGIKNSLSKEPEIKLEMECNAGDLNKVIDAMLKKHPYDETVYEIYDFMKRDKRQAGVIINLKSDMTLTELFRRINRDLKHEEEDGVSSFRRIAFTDSADETILMSAKVTNCKYLLISAINNYKLYKTH